MRLFGKSKRARLGEAVRRELSPLLLERGFRNPRKHDRERWGGSRLDVFLRWQGVDFDEVRIEWRSANRPSFSIHFKTSRFERDGDGRPTAFRRQTTGSVCVWLCHFCGGICEAQFGRWQSVRRAMHLASRRVIELDDYLSDNVAGPHIAIGREVRIGPGLHPPEVSPWWRRFGDPKLDPESDVTSLG